MFDKCLLTLVLVNINIIVLSVIFGYRQKIEILKGIHNGSSFNGKDLAQEQVLDFLDIQNPSEALQTALRDIIKGLRGRTAYAENICEGQAELYNRDSFYQPEYHLNFKPVPARNPNKNQ